MGHSKKERDKATQTETKEKEQVKSRVHGDKTKKKLRCVACNQDNHKAENTYVEYASTALSLQSRATDSACRLTLPEVQTVPSSNRMKTVMCPAASTSSNYSGQPITPDACNEIRKVVRTAC